MSCLSYVNLIAMIKRSVFFSLLSILFVCYFNSRTNRDIAKEASKSSDSLFVSQTIGVQQDQAKPAVISSEIIPIIKKYRFLVSPY